MVAPLPWEHIEYDRYDSPTMKRLKVPDGWLVMSLGYHEDSICFYPDSEHAWKIPLEPETVKCEVCEKNFVPNEKETVCPRCVLAYKNEDEED